MRSVVGVDTEVRRRAGILPQFQAGTTWSTSQIMAYNQYQNQTGYPTYDLMN